MPIDKCQLMIEMKIKTVLGYSYRVIEVLLILSITAGIVSMGLSSHDSAEMIGLLMTNIGALAWLWFISLPLLLIVFVSFLRCSIPPLSIYKKVVLLLHLLNVVLWFVFYVILPKPEPCDAAIMEEHYKNHHDDMYDLVRYQFALYDYPLKEKERDEFLRSHQFILYNDSVVFEAYGDYCDLRGFPDKDKFQPLNEVNK